MNKIVPTLCLLALVSCGNSGSKNSSGVKNPPQMQIAEGTYKAILRPYNFTVSGWIPNGMTDIKIDGEQIVVKSWLDDSSNVVHMQNIHLGTKCPAMGDDFNKDGFVDFNESMKVSKKIFMPLDADINSQSRGRNGYPQGNFTYFQNASLQNVIEDLKLQDFDDNDFTVKLPQAKSLNLEGKVIIVTGAAANRNLPPTVSRVNNQTPELSIPIACGVIERMPDLTN